MWKLTNSVKYDTSPLINSQSVSCKILYMYVEFERISLVDLHLYFLKTQKYYRRLPTGGSWQSIMKRAAAKVHVHITSQKHQRSALSLRSLSDL